MSKAKGKGKPKNALEALLAVEKPTRIEWCLEVMRDLPMPERIEGCAEALLEGLIEEWQELTSGLFDSDGHENMEPAVKVWQKLIELIPDVVLM